MNLKNIFITLFFILCSFSTSAEELNNNQNTEFNVYTGVVDFFDVGKKSKFFCFENQN